MLGSRLVLCVALVLIFAKMQCVSACAMEACGSKVPPCHKHSQSSSSSKACGHDVSAAIVAPVQAVDAPALVVAVDGEADRLAVEICRVVVAAPSAFHLALARVGRPVLLPARPFFPLESYVYSTVALWWGSAFSMFCTGHECGGHVADEPIFGDGFESCFVADADDHVACGRVEHHVHGRGVSGGRSAKRAAWWR